MIRPRISLPLPAANGTTMVTGRAGQSCAAAGAAASTSVARAAIILVSGMRAPSVRGDVGRLDDRPPLLDLGLLVGAERLAGSAARAAGFPGRDRASCWRTFGSASAATTAALSLAMISFGRALGGPDRVPQRDVEARQPGLVHASGSRAPRRAASWR